MFFFFFLELYLKQFLDMIMQFEWLLEYGMYQK